METALLRCRPRTPETPAASRPRGKRSQQPVLSTWLPLKSEQPEASGRSCPEDEISSPSGCLPFIPASGAQWHQVSKTGKGPQSWRLQCFGKVPSWQAGTGQGALDLPPKFSSILWWRGRKDQKPYSLKNHLHKPNPDSEFSLLECLQTFYYSHCSSPHCVSLVQSVYLLSSVQWETTEETPHRVWGLNTSNTTATCCLWRGISSRLS